MHRDLTPNALEQTPRPRVWVCFWANDTRAFLKP
jgi:hypothetical protein